MKITKPSLILNEAVCKRNIQQMAEKAKRNHCVFRPHFKTHQSIEVGTWFKEAGVKSICVSSVKMAKYFMQDGWKDITIAIPVNVLELDQIGEMATKIQLNLLVDSVEAVKSISEGLKSKVGLFIKVDTGYHRTGVLSEDFEAMDALIEEITQSDKADFMGFLTHSGHAYQARNMQEFQMIYEDVALKLKRLKERYQSSYKNLQLSYGDTPSLSCIESFEEMDEIRPGNFVFYDLMQKNLGVCELEDIALTVACPVISKSLERNECVIYGGAVHFAKEQSVNVFDQVTYGQIKKINGKDITEEIHLQSMSQEHGIIQLSNKQMQELSIGDLIEIYPIHSCLTANLHAQYHLASGKTFSKDTI